MDGNYGHVCEAVQPTIMQATPATWRMLIEAGWLGSDRLTVLCGGEALPPDLAAALFDRSAALWNMYGPTETTIWSTIERIERADQEITIGRPIANTEMYILDQFLQPVPVGVSGELYIGGHGLARGYRKRPELTKERFVPHPFSTEPHARLYRTGDLVRYRPDGRIVHLGRLDHQVKIRGFRIELGEIEAVLSRHPAVRQVVVTAREDQQGLKQLVAYLVCQEGQAPSPTELRSFVRAALPDYMTPSFFVFLDAMPLTANNKIDMQALPDSGRLCSQTDWLTSVHVIGLEVQLAAIWQQVLGVPQIGIHDNFFDLGGHSPQGGTTLLSSRAGIWATPSARHAVSSADHCRVSVGPCTRTVGAAMAIAGGDSAERNSDPDFHGAGSGRQCLDLCPVGEAVGPGSAVLWIAGTRIGWERVAVYLGAGDGEALCR